MRAITIKIIFFIIMSILFVTEVFSAENLLNNPGMEIIADGKPKDWSTWEFNRSAAKYSVDTGDAKEGNRYGTIICDQENDARFTQHVAVNENTMPPNNWIGRVLRRGFMPKSSIISPILISGVGGNKV